MTTIALPVNVHLIHGLVELEFYHFELDSELRWETTYNILYTILKDVFFHL